jgi:hypothetical protein
VATADLPIESRLRCQYIAYSYCWGPLKADAEYTTKQCNFDARLRSFCITELPVAFQELFRIAYELGISFLWVDALCIIQLDEEDWTTESVRMRYIYENAYLTIAATSTSSPMEDISNRKGYIPHLARAEINGNGRIFSLCQSIYSLWDRRNISQIWPDTIKSRWLHRAWTFQEKELSRRVLYICYTQYIFECISHLREESLDTVSLVSFSTLCYSKRVQKKETILDEWYGEMAQFSDRQLTNQLDKLPAISGLADCVLNAHKDEYLAGLWRSDLEMGLLWARWSEKLTQCHPYRAPTWSFTAYNGYIEWPFHNNALYTLQTTCVIEDARIFSNERAKLSGITGGYIRIVGRMKRVKLRDSSSQDSTEGTNGGIPFIHCDQTVYDDTSHIRFGFGHIDTVEMYNAYQSTANDTDLHIWAILIGVSRQLGSKGDTSTVYFSTGLLLSESGPTTTEHSSVQRAFRRVGMWVAWGDVAENWEHSKITIV